MNQFLVVFHNDQTVNVIPSSEDEIQMHLKHWQDWFRSLAAQDKLAAPVQCLDTDEKFWSRMI